MNCAFVYLNSLKRKSFGIIEFVCDRTIRYERPVATVQPCSPFLEFWTRKLTWSIYLIGSILQYGRISFFFYFHLLIGWGHLPSEAKASEPFNISFRTEFSRSENPKINNFFLVRTTSGDDVIVTDKTSKTSTAVSWQNIIKTRIWI